MTQNIPKLSFLILSASRWTCGRAVIYIFLCPRSTGVGRQKRMFFAQRLKKNFFTSILMGRSGNKTIFLGFIIFSRENSLVSRCVTEKTSSFAIIAPSKKMFVFAELTLTLRQTFFIRN